MIRVRIAALLISIAAVASAQDSSDDPATLWEQATLYRDDWGVPHVFADNPRAMAFAFGYAQAQDHLAPMLLAYRVANARLSEVLGAEAEASDRMAIRLNHAGLALNAYQLADATTRDLCEGFALGVNTWITENPDAEPEWKEGVQPADVLALLHRYLLGQAPFDYASAPHLLPSTPSANAWAVGPSLSQTRQPMLVINPHSDFEGAYQWYEAHLVTRDMNVYGATIFGLPVIMQGFNSSLGWALSPNKPDTADLFVEYPDQDSPGVRFTESESRVFYTKTPNGFVENIENRLATARGPVVAEIDGRAVSWQVGGYRDFGALRQLYDMGRAQDLDQFRRALDRQQLSSFHTIYADATGNIFYRYNATTGLRVDTGGVIQDAGFGNEGSAADIFEAPVSGQGHRFDWGPTLGPETMPWILNPESGYVQACGSPPWLATSPSTMNASSWPGWFARDDDSYRAKRVRRLFSMGPRSFEDMQAMLFDTVSPLAAEAVPYLLSLAEQNPDFVNNAHPDLRVMLDILRDWNFLADTRSTAMTVFHVWWSLLQLDDDGSTRPNEIVHRLIQEDAPWFQEHALQSASEAAQLLRNEYQTLNVFWGDVHVIARGAKEYPLAGGHSGDPIFYTGDRRFDDGKWRVNEGYGFAMVVRFGGTPEAVSLAPFGTSEVPSSPHYDDQLQLMLSRRFKVARYEREDIERHTESAEGRRLLFRPGRQSGTVFLAADTPLTGHLRETAASPAALPEGLAAFTTYVEPVIESPPSPLSVELNFRVDETVCDPGDLESLFLYGYHPVDGWRQLEDQSLDGEQRAFSGLVGRAEVFAVLGPESARRADPALVRTEETRKAPAVDQVARVLNAKSDALPAADNDDAKLTDLNPEDQERVATLVPPAPHVLIPSNRAAPPDSPMPDNVIAGTTPLLVLPAVPPGFEPQPPIPQDVFVPRESKPLTPLDAQASAGTTTAPAEPEDTTPSPAALATSPPAPAQLEAPAPAGTSVAEASATQQKVASVPAPAPSAIAPAPVKRGVSFSVKTPKEMLGPNAAGPSSSFELAPDPSQASPLQIGRELEMRTPDGAAVFTMRTSLDTRAQAFPRRVPPGPFPEGMAAFSAVYEVVADPPPNSTNTAILVRVDPDAVVQERFGELKLFVFDSSEGWKAFEKQRVNAEAHTISTMDINGVASNGGRRIYAVLGPADAARAR